MSLKVKLDAMNVQAALERSQGQAAAALVQLKSDASSLLATIDANTGGDFSANDRSDLVAKINTWRSQLQTFLNNWPAAT